MIKNKEVVMHAKEVLGIANATSLEKSCIESANLENLVVLRRCNSLPLAVSNNIYCDWRTKNASTVHNRFITNNSYRQSVNSTDTPIYNYELYNVQSETKSLQELQIKVDALLEFRELVIETFPDLKNKFISMSSAAITANRAKLHSSPSIRQTKLKKLRKDSHTSFTVQRPPVLNSSAIVGESSPVYVSRSRSNSNSCKKEPKSGEGSGSAVQDSGFSTETTSSKDGHSASSTSVGLQGAIISNRPDDELLNLLDVIYRKTSKIRQKFSSMQNYERDKYDAYASSASIPNILNSSSFLRKIPRCNSTESSPRENALLLRKERDKLLDKVADMESQRIEDQIKILELEKQIEDLCTGNNNLEEQLKLALSQNEDLNSKFLKCELDSDPSRKFEQSLNSSTTSNQIRSTPRLIANKSLTSSYHTGSFNFRSSSFKDTEIIRQQKMSLSTNSEFKTNSEEFGAREAGSTLRRTRRNNSDKIPRNVRDELKIKTLGRLDGIVSFPKHLCKVREIDSKKISAILMETNMLELQRHLLTLTVQNQILTQKLDDVMKSKHSFVRRMSGSKEEVTDQKLQTRKPCIEPTQTSASVSRTSQNVVKYPTETIANSKPCSDLNASPAAVTSNKKENDEHKPIENHTDCVHSQDTHIQAPNEYVDTFQTPKRSKPSKIPLPGSKTLSSSKVIGHISHSSSPPFTAIHKSLSCSTGNISFRHTTNRLNRQDSLIIKNRRSSPSISSDIKTISSRSVFITSPLPKIKRDSVTARVRQLDNLAVSRRTNDKINLDQKNNSPSQSIAQNKSTKLSSSSYISPTANNSPVTSPSRSVSAKKDSNPTTLATSKRNTVLRKESDDKPVTSGKIIQTHIRSNSNNTNIHSSVTNSDNSSITLDDQYNDVDVVKVRNIRTALMSWLKK